MNRFMHTQTPPTSQSVLLTWEAPQHPAFVRTARWYWTAGSVIIAVAAYGFFFEAWSMAIIALMCGGLYVMVHEHKPSAKIISITGAGILLEQTFTRFDELEGFCFLETPAYTELHFVRKKRGNDVIIQTGTMDIMQLRISLGTYIPELKDKKEPLLDLLARTLKL